MTSSGNAFTIMLPVALPVAFVAVMTNDQDVSVNEVNLAVPVDELDGVAVVPLIVYVFVTDVPVPPDQETVNPVGVTAAPPIYCHTSDSRLNNISF